MSGYPSVSIAILIWHRHCNRKFSNSLSFCLQSHHEHGNTSLCIHLRQSYSLVKANSFCKFDIHGSVHRGWFSRNTNKMQFCNRIYYSQVYWRLNMFRAAQRSSSGALNSICSLWFIYPCGDRPLQLSLDNGRSPHGYINQRLQIQFRAPDDERCAARNMLSLQ